MMSSENIPPPASAAEMQAAGNRKGSNQRGSQTHEQQPLKCPRCDSSNTKFCYYNNYSLSQPRHFCKTCRRYWTKGGALRNVPIGGGCRKTKKLKPSSAATSAAAAASSLLSRLDSPAGPDFKFLAPSAMDFQLGGLSLPRLHPATAGVYTQFVTGGGAGSGCFGLDLLAGLSYPGPNSSAGSGHTTTATSVVSSVLHQDHPVSLSSIESLSSINQEMHWKLQQQRLAMIYGNHPTATVADDDQDGGAQKQKEKPATAMNLFQNLEVNNNHHSNPKVTDSNNDDDHEQVINCGVGRKLEVVPTEWFFDQAHYAPSNNATNNSANEIGTTGGHLNGVHHHHAASAATWGDLHQFNGLQ